MSDSGWRGDSAPWIVVGFGLVLFAAISFWNLYSEGYKAASEHHASNRAASNASQEDHEECLAKPTVKIAVECAYSSRNATKEEQESADNLNTQREISNWAGSTMWATWLVGAATVIIAGLAAWWVKLTLDATREAVIETRRIGEAQSRAYLSVERVVVDAPEVGKKLIAKIFIENTGSTPAYDVSGWYSIRVFRKLVGDVEGAVPEHFAVLGAGKGRRFNFLASNRNVITQPMIDRFEKGKMSVFIYGQISYDDAFKKRWLLSYNFEYERGCGEGLARAADFWNEEIQCQKEDRHTPHSPPPL